MILDTNALSAIADKNSDVLAVVAGADQLALPVITIAEFRFGLLGSIRPAAGNQLVNSLENAVPVLAPDKTTAVQYAEIADSLKRAGTPIPQTISGSPPLPANTAGRSSPEINTSTR